MIRTALAAATLTAAASLMVGGVAGATTPLHDRPCVDKREFYGAQVATPRGVLEAKWEVTGRGVRLRSYEARKTYVVGYPVCGYSVKNGQIIVQYRKRDDAALAAEREVSGRPTSHPRG